MYSFDEYDYFPSGRLFLRIETWGYSEIRKAWADGKKQRLENLLNSFVAGIIKTAESVHAWKMNREKEENERQERIRQHEERERVRREEKEKLQALEREVEAWHRSKRIRSYLEAVRTLAFERHGGIEPGSELDHWVSWAEEQADQLDPLHVKILS
jgi:hypothetical protein